MAAQDTGAAGTAGSGPGGVRDAARETIESVRQEASGLAGRATEHGKTLLTRQKESAAEQIDSVARALESSAGQLQDGRSEQAGRFVHYAAQQLQDFGRVLRDRDADTLMRDVQQMGRRAPGAFFAGSVVAGFLLSRFLKASAERRTPRYDDAPDADPWASGTGAGYGLADTDFGETDLRSARADLGTGTPAGTSTGPTPSSGPFTDGRSTTDAGTPSMARAGTGPDISRPAGGRDHGR